MRRPSLVLVLALVFACAEPDEDATQTAGTASSTGTSDDASTGDASTGDASTGGQTSTSPATTNAADTEMGSESSTGVACPEGAPATFSEIEGCAEVLGESFCVEGRQHIKQGTELTFESNPPHSGDHYPTWAAWGEQDSTLPRGNWVHNLEHGGIALIYLCPNGCDEDLEVYRSVIEQRPDLRFIMTSDPELGEAGFAAVSWTWVLRFDTPDLETLLCFADQHENHAPEDVP